MKFLIKFTAIMLLANLRAIQAADYRLYVPDIDGSESLIIKLPRKNMNTVDLSTDQENMIKVLAVSHFNFSRKIFGINDIDSITINGNNIFVEMRSKFIDKLAKKNAHHSLLQHDVPVTKKCCCTIS